MASSSAKHKAERDKLLKKIAEKRERLEQRGDVRVKIPRLSLPSDYNIQSTPLFSLPPEIIKPILATGYPDYKKKIARAKKKGNCLCHFAKIKVKTKYFKQE